MSLTRLFLWVIALLSIQGCTSNLSTPPVTTTERFNPMPTDYSFIANFTPSYACELQNIELNDTQTCRFERIEEIIVGGDSQNLLIQQYRQDSSGCASNIFVQEYKLLLCNRQNGHRTDFTPHLASGIVISPDAISLAFATVQPSSNGSIPVIDILRLRRDGTNLQKLNPLGLPPNTAAIEIRGWSADANWLFLDIWNGNDYGWYEYRLRTDGSGHYQEQEDTSTSELLTAQNAIYTAGVATPLRECPQESCPVVLTIPILASAPIIERFTETDDRYWLKLDYRGQHLYAGVFIKYRNSALSMLQAGRTCPDEDCPVSIILSLNRQIDLLLLEAITVDLIIHWMRVAYNGEIFYLGPYVPLGPSAQSAVVIPATQTAAAQGTYSSPEPFLLTPQLQAYPTLTPSPTPSANPEISSSLLTPQPTPGTPPSQPPFPTADCFSPPHRPDNGIAVGSMVVVVQEAYMGNMAMPRGGTIATLSVGDQLLVIDGPGCWESGSRREWRVLAFQFTNDEIEGYVAEYVVYSNSEEVTYLRLAE